MLELNTRACGCEFLAVQSRIPRKRIRIVNTFNGAWVMRGIAIPAPTHPCILYARLSSLLTLTFSNFFVHPLRRHPLHLLYLIIHIPSPASFYYGYIQHAFIVLDIYPRVFNCLFILWYQNVYFWYLYLHLSPILTSSYIDID